MGCLSGCRVCFTVVIRSVADALREAPRLGHAAIRLRAMFLTRAVTMFAGKFSQIIRQHRAPRSKLCFLHAWLRRCMRAPVSRRLEGQGRLLVGLGLRLGE